MDLFRGAAIPDQRPTVWADAGYQSGRIADAADRRPFACRAPAAPAEIDCPAKLRGTRRDRIDINAAVCWPTTIRSFVGPLEQTKHQRFKAPACQVRRAP